MKGAWIKAVVVLQMLVVPSLALAADAASGASGVSAAAPGSMPMSPFQFIFGTVQFFLIGFFIYFWMAIRPEQLRNEERKKFVGELKKNDEVLTSGGLVGRIVSVKDDYATLEIASNVKVRVHCDHVQALPPAPVAPEGQRLQTHINKSSEQ